MGNKRKRKNAIQSFEDCNKVRQEPSEAVHSTFERSEKRRKKFSVLHKRKRSQEEDVGVTV